LAERHKVPVMIGPLATNEALAMDGYIRETQVPLITTTSAATVDLKSHALNPWVLHAFGYGTSGDLSTRRLRGQEPRL
jgi:branched-chain amino acid transport system substrate-binding protein